MVELFLENKLDNKRNTDYTDLADSRLLIENAGTKSVKIRQVCVIHDAVIVSFLVLLLN